MHNFNLTPVPTESQNATNLSILEDSCNNNSYSYWIPATMLYNDGSASAATFFEGTSTIPPCWNLADAVTSGVGFYMKRHGDWKYGSFDVNVHWSTDTNSNSVVFGVSCDLVKEAVALAASTTINITVPVITRLYPHVSLLQSSLLRQQSLIDRSSIGAYFHLRRIGGNASDTNTGTVSIYGIELVYNEVKRVIGDVIKK